MPAASCHAHARHLAGAAAALLAACSLAGCAGGSSAPSASSPLAGQASASGFAGAALPPGIEAPGFALTDQHGRRVSLGGYRGRVTILAFLYSACGSSCVLIAQQIRGALDELAHPAPVLILSADPAGDTPARVARFLSQVSLTGRAEYLTGSPSRLAHLLRSYRVTPPAAGRGAFERSTSVLLLDRRGRERVLFQIEQLTPESLAHDIRRLETG
jgi:cytochrome oxidase Cu insertion factor (SCO1/SenC/PrrC family)